MDLEELRIKRVAHNSYIRYERKRGKEIGTWECEHCGDTNETVIPTPDLVNERGCWDSAKTCVECGELSFVQVYPDGDIIVTPI